MIITTTLANAAAIPLISDALTSAAFADHHLVIDTSPDGPPAFVTDDPKITVTRLVWPDDFAAARNLALVLAHNLGATWAVTLDTDERILGGDALRAAIETTAAPALSLAAADGSYAKPRAFRLPCAAGWRGLTHEAIAIDAPTVTGAAFAELPKTEEQLQAKRRRDLQLLHRMAAHEPTDGRWRYYLGDTLAALGRHGEACHEWARCAEVSTWDEESAWACYRAADVYLFVLEHPRAALEWCVRGMQHHPGVAELPWLAAIACQRLGRHEHALHWAALARVHGERSAAPLRALDHRRGFRAVKGLRHGPADVERFSLRALGMDDAAAAAEMEFALMEAAR
jgi:tetratricopeptide (TPR) repeat protein